MTQRTSTRDGFYRRQREAHLQSIREQDAASVRRRVLELLDAGHEEGVIAALVGWPVELVKRIAGERGR